MQERTKVLYHLSYTAEAVTGVEPATTLLAREVTVLFTTDALLSKELSPGSPLGGSAGKRT